MSNYMYYPGCSMEGSGRSYRESIAGICEPLGLSLVEIEDWNCCGATEYVGVSLSPAYSLIARNLAIAARTKQESEPLVAACSACYLNLAKADAYMKERPQLNDHVNEALSAGGLHYDAGTVEVRHLLEVIMNDVGLDKVREKVVKPLAGLRVAPYLGCMLPRPDPDHRWKNHERPDDLDRLLAALGADVVDFPLKTECCGGHMTQIAPGVGLELIKRLVDEAEHDGADMMVTVCPMCQINIDAYQGEMNAKYHTRHKMPIVFFTQLMGIAFGLEPKAVGIGREVTDARRALQRIGRPLEPAPKEEPAHRPRPDKRALPMPRMKTDSPEGEPETVEVAR
jgi:heterodisulfide reductase subunit B